MNLSHMEKWRGKKIAVLSPVDFGVPVIAMDAGSCREVIADGVTGCLVNDVSETVAALDRLSEIDRRNCRERVETHFSIETMVSGYDRVYASLFESGS